MPKPFPTAPAPARISISRWATRSKNLFHDAKDKRGWAVEMGYHFLGGLLEHARALLRLRADRQFVQAAGRWPRAVRRDLGAGLHRLRRQQPHAWCAFRRGGSSCDLPDGLQSVSCRRRRSSPRDRWGGAQARSGSRPTTSTSSRRTAMRQQIGLLPQSLIEAIGRARAGRSREGAGSARISPPSSSRSSAWSGSNIRATFPTGKRSATWSSSRCAESSDCW